MAHAVHSCMYWAGTLVVVQQKGRAQQRAPRRHVLDLADWDRGLATSAPGQSGQPGSPHYGDLLPLWAAGKYFPLAFSRKKVEDVMRHHLELRPARHQ